MLAEREKRMGVDSINNSTDDLNEKSNRQTAQHLLEEIRQAVTEANARGLLMFVNIYRSYALSQYYSIFNNIILKLKFTHTF